MRTFVGELRGRVDLLAFGPGQRLIAACAGGDCIELWDAVTGTRADVWQAARRRVLDLGMLADGRAVVAVGGQPLQIINPDPYRKFSELLPAKNRRADAVDVARDADTLVTTHIGNVPLLTVWQPGPDGAYKVMWSREYGSHHLGFAVSANGEMVAIARSLPRSAVVLIVATSTDTDLVQVPVGHWREVCRLAFLRDSSHIAALHDGQVSVFTATKPPSVTKFGVALQLTSVAPHPDGRHVLTAGADGVARVWDADTGAEVAAFAWPVGRLGAVAVSRDGTLAAAGGEDGKIVVWDVDV